MSLVPFDLNEVEAFYKNYYQLQDGNGLSVLSGKRVMDGDGSFLRGAFKAAAPAFKGLAKSAIGTLGRTALRVATDALRGQNAAESASRRFRDAGANILDSAGSALEGIGGDAEASPTEIKRELKRRAPMKKKTHGQARQDNILKHDTYSTANRLRGHLNL